VGSVPEEHRTLVAGQERAAEAYRLWQTIPPDKTGDDASHLRQELTKKIEAYCAPQIMTAILRNQKEAGLCGVYIVPTQNPPYTVLWTWREDPEIIHEGIHKAVSTFAISDTAQFHEHVKVCVTKNILEKSAELAGKLRELKPRALLEVCNSATLVRTRFIVEHLREDQRAALSSLLFHELGGKPRPLRMDKEPQIPEHPTLKQKQAWLHWYIWCLRMHKPEMQRVSGGVPLVVVAADGDRLLTDKRTGLPADPLGPIHAPVYRALGRELNRQGHPIKDPESENRVAKSVGVSPDKLRSYPSLPIDIETDGPGRIKYEYTGDSLLVAIEASLRKKPTKSDNS
jgi:hypothetical protein